MLIWFDFGAISYSHELHRNRHLLADKRIGRERIQLTTKRGEPTETWALLFIRRSLRRLPQSYMISIGVVKQFLHNF